MKLVNMSHAFGGNTTLTTLYINYETGLGKRQRQGQTQWKPHIVSWQTKEGDVGSLASLAAKSQGLEAYLLMHMGGGRENRLQRHRRGLGVG